MIPDFSELPDIQDYIQSSYSSLTPAKLREELSKVERRIGTSDAIENDGVRKIILTQLLGEE